MRVAVLTIDQRGSSHDAATDRVPATLLALADVEMLRPFERTAGDEFQGVLVDPAALAAVVERLLREESWNVGIGIGRSMSRSPRAPGPVAAPPTSTPARRSPPPSPPRGGCGSPATTATTDRASAGSRPRCGSGPRS